MSNPPKSTSPTASSPARLNALVDTDRAQRFLDQLARHAVKVSGSLHQRPDGPGHQAPQVHVEHYGSACTLTFPNLGACTVTASSDHLLIQVDAADADSAQRIADVVTTDLRRFSQRHPLTITWKQG